MHKLGDGIRSPMRKPGVSRSFCRRFFKAVCPLDVQGVHHCEVQADLSVTGWQCARASTHDQGAPDQILRVPELQAAVGVKASPGGHH